MTDETLQLGACWAYK
jgi:hypothetical protein